ncbi:aldo/keto reductase [Pontibacter ramchanderi]|uniref:Aryl-alcohol dehydrogenase-like predicted oxidoreductase n=1 Tax=Pontibacter ramchanderi TaxID=1179743 RepID=A0A2N3U7I0_9BACT|nr:aldo/keto reductase [Pontibacter ramchanderi]PKV62711.1 aryl-alcohol dehydrogenase-like predicted oxidoreductase [Pontibacter ramchanderi]
MTSQTYTNRLILGTAQFGLPYGISNQRGQIPEAEIATILTEAAKAGIDTLDTAAAYGSSEQCLGNVLHNLPAPYRIISKYPPNSPDKSIAQACRESLKRLRVEKLYGYLLHSYASYSSKPALLDELQELKASGLTERVGLSLYHPAEAEALLKQEAQIDILQFPYNIFDRRFEELLPELQNRGIETHVRSVYLQGLFFMQPDRLPLYLQGVTPKLEQLQLLANSYQLPIGAVCLAFALANPYISQVVIGVESLQTLQENIRYSSTELPPAIYTALQELKEENENIILPYKWPAH